MKHIVKRIGSLKSKDFLLSKEKKEVKEEEKERVVEDPAKILEEDIQLEDSSEDVIKDAEGVPEALESLVSALKKLNGSNKQLVSVGKHLAKQVTDAAMEKQLTSGHETLNAWSEFLTQEIKKLGPPYISSTLKVMTVKKLVKVCKHTSLATTVVLLAVKSVAAFDAENANVQKQVSMSTRTVRDAVSQLLSAWESFPTTAISDLDITNQIGSTSKQIISMCDNVEVVGPEMTIATLSSTKQELFAACRAAAAATARLIYANTDGKYTSITSATTTLKVIISTATQVLAVTNTVNSFLFKQDDSSSLKVLLTSASQALKKAADRLEGAHRERSQTKLLEEAAVASEPEQLEPEPEPEPTRLATRSVSAPVVSAAATTLSKPRMAHFLSKDTHNTLSSTLTAYLARAFTTTPAVLPRSTPISPQPIKQKYVISAELKASLAELQTMIDKQIALPPIPPRKKSGNSPNISADSPNLPSSPPPSSPLNKPLTVQTSDPSLFDATTPPSKRHINTSDDSNGVCSSNGTHNGNHNGTSNGWQPNSGSSDTNNSDDNSKAKAPLASTPPMDIPIETQQSNFIGQSRSFYNARRASLSPRQAPRVATSPRDGEIPDTWSAVRPESKISRASMRINRTDIQSILNPPRAISPPTSPTAVSAPSNNPLASPTTNPTPPINSLSVSGSSIPTSPPPSSTPISPPPPNPTRKTSRKGSPDDMTLAKLFNLIPGTKTEKPTPFASKQLLKALIALVAAYNCAINLKLVEVKEATARAAESGLPRSPSSHNISSSSIFGEQTPASITTQQLIDSMSIIEAAIPQLPLSPPPPQPSPEKPNGHQSGDGGGDIWAEPADEEGVNVMSTEAGKIKAGTLNKLVERLTSPTHADLKFTYAFITTYRSFCTPDVLLHKIMQRFDVPETEPSNECTAIQLRVCNVLRHWVEKQYFDFDAALLDTLVGFIEDKLVNHKSYKTFATSILNTISTKKQESEAPRLVSNDLRSDSIGIQLTPSRLLFVFDEGEIAKQLTLIDFSIYSAIQPAELLNLAWNNPKYRYRSPHVIALIARANVLSNWVASVILWQPRLKDRVKIMAKMISIAKHLLDLNNFNSLVAMLAGINNSAIHRLRVSKEDLPKQSQDTFKELEEVMNVNASYKTYRALLHNVNPPCLPFLGVYLTDLTFVEEGNPDMLKGLINFGKREMVHNSLAEIQQYQLTPYVFPLVDSITNISSFMHRNTFDFYKI